MNPLFPNIQCSQFITLIHMPNLQCSEVTLNNAITKYYTFQILPSTIQYLEGKSYMCDAGEAPRDHYESLIARAVKASY